MSCGRIAVITFGVGSSFLAKDPLETAETQARRKIVLVHVSIDFLQANQIRIVIWQKPEEIDGTFETES